MEGILLWGDEGGGVVVGKEKRVVGVASETTPSSRLSFHGHEKRVDVQDDERSSGVPSRAN